MGRLYTGALVKRESQKKTHKETMMAFSAFSSSCVYERTLDQKDKFSIQCVECHLPNIYVGTKQGSIHDLILLQTQSLSPSRAKERLARKLSSSAVSRIRLVPVYNRLLALSNRSITALDMSSLETNQSFKKIPNVSQFEVRQRDGRVELVLCCGNKKQLRVIAVQPDRWTLLKEFSLVGEPLELAVQGACVCVATSEQYLLCDVDTGQREALFHHGHNSQRLLVRSSGPGEFLLNGPGGLGLFVNVWGVCQRAPLQWPAGVLAACVCPPYALCLEGHELLLYSLLDQQCKQRLSVTGALGLTPTPDGALVFTDRAVLALRPVPLEDQLQVLLQQDQLHEALLLLESEHGTRLDPHGDLLRSVTCRAGFHHFHQESFEEATHLFTKGELDPRELLCLFPGLQSTLPADFHPHTDLLLPQSRAQELQGRWSREPGTLQRYLGFVSSFLGAVRTRRSAEQEQAQEEVDCALLWLHVHTANTEALLQLLAHPHACALQTCEPVLTQHHRFFALGMLFESQEKHQEAIQIWVKLVEEQHTDPSCALSRSELLQHIVSRLGQLEDTEALWTLAPWALHQDQETGVQMFTKRSAQTPLPSERVLALLQTYPQARINYLEFLTHDTSTKDSGHHTELALAYVSQCLQSQQDPGSRGKLRELLWESDRYHVSTVYERVVPTTLYMERAILMGRTGDHRGALKLLVEACPDTATAEEYCSRLSTHQDFQSTQSPVLELLHIYMSEGCSPAVLDLLKKYPHLLSGQKALQVLPESWSVQLLSGFLVGSTREAFHRGRMKTVEEALERARLHRHKALWIQASSAVLRLDGRQVCEECGKPVTRPGFVLTPPGGLLHLDCANHSATAPTSQGLELQA